MDKFYPDAKKIIDKIKAHPNFRANHSSVKFNNEEVHYYVADNNDYYFCLKHRCLRITFARGKCIIAIEFEDINADFNPEHLALWSWFYELKKIVGVK